MLKKNVFFENFVMGVAAILDFYTLAQFCHKTFLFLYRFV